MAQSKTAYVKLISHSVVVTIMTAVLFGLLFSWALLILLATHTIIDFAKTKLKQDNALAFIVDQAAHLAILIATSCLFENLSHQGVWYSLLSTEQWNFLIKGLVILSGLILLLPVGGILIAKCTEKLLPIDQRKQNEGLMDGGRYIGLLERALIAILVFGQMTDGFGFLIAAKSILRFSEVKDSDSRAIVEYVILGTFMSFAWGLLVSLLTRFVLLNL